MPADRVPRFHAPPMITPQTTTERLWVRPASILQARIPAADLFGFSGVEGSASGSNDGRSRSAGKKVVAGSPLLSTIQINTNPINYRLMVFLTEMNCSKPGGCATRALGALASREVLPG